MQIFIQDSNDPNVTYAYYELRNCQSCEWHSKILIIIQFINLLDISEEQFHNLKLKAEYFCLRECGGNVHKFTHFYRSDQLEN